MLLTLLSVFFAWLILRELKQHIIHHKPYTSFDLGYLTVLILCTSITAWPPIKYWQFERLLSQKAVEISGHPDANVHCNSPVDAIFDNDPRRIGHAQPETGDIVLQYQWCKHLMAHLAHPEILSDDELMSLNLFTHEVMHIRGELNEAKTECQSIQRNHKVAELLGVPTYLAEENARAYYQNIYPRHPYYSSKYAPGKAYDEALPGAVWDS